MLSIKKKYIKECPYCRTIINLEDYKKTCVKILASGKNAGKLCGKKCYNDASLCKIHSKPKKIKLTLTDKSFCKAILKSGKNAGNQCTCKAKINGYCKRHLPKLIAIQNALS